MSSEVVEELLALDVGERRIGVARANTLAKIPEPLAVIDTKSDDAIDKIKSLANEMRTNRIIIGNPESLHTRNETAQSQINIEFGEKLQVAVAIPVVYVNEALSTVEASNWSNRYPTADEDSLAACVILQRYIDEELV